MAKSDKELADKLDAQDRLRALKDSLHKHIWIDARNEVVVSGEYCSVCGAMC